MSKRIAATVYCPNDTVVEILTTSPFRMTKSPIAQVSGTTNQWETNLTWIPTVEEIGPQVSDYRWWDDDYRARRFL